MMARLRTGGPSSEGALLASPKRQTREGSGCCLLAAEDQVLPSSPASSLGAQDPLFFGTKQEGPQMRTREEGQRHKWENMEEEKLYEQKRGGEFKERERQIGTEKEKREAASQGQRSRETRTSQSVWPGPGLSDLSGGFLPSQRCEVSLQ